MLEELMTPEKNQETTGVRVNLEELIQKSLSQNEEILQLARQIKSHIRWQVAWSFIRLFLIIIPIILGFIYLPPLLKEFLETYSFLMPY